MTFDVFSFNHAEHGLPLHSDRNPLHNIPRDLALPSVIEPGSARVGVAGQVLHLFVRIVLTVEYVPLAVFSERSEAAKPNTSCGLIETANFVVERHSYNQLLGSRHIESSSYGNSVSADIGLPATQFAKDFVAVAAIFCRGT